MLSKEYAKERTKLIDPLQNDPNPQPGDPYPYIGKTNPFHSLLKQRDNLLTDTAGLQELEDFVPKHDATGGLLDPAEFDLATTETADSLYQDRLLRGTTTVEAADAEGWVVSITPSGGVGCQFKERMPRAGSILLSRTIPQKVVDQLKTMGYSVSLGNRTSGPINAIFIDQKHGSLWGGSSNNGEDYGIGW